MHPGGELAIYIVYRVVAGATVPANSILNIIFQLPSASRLRKLPVIIQTRFRNSKLVSSSLTTSLLCACVIYR